MNTRSTQQLALLIMAGVVMTPFAAAYAGIDFLDTLLIVAIGLATVLVLFSIRPSGGG
jgi:hypothetical protein